MSGLPAAYKRLKGVKGGGLGSKPRIPKAEIEGNFVQEFKDERVSQILSRLGSNTPADYKMAKRVIKLQEEYPNGTLPELICMDWLNQRQIRYYYLVQIFGGHARRGGIEVDLLVDHGGRGIAILVNGDYWHGIPEVAESDMADKVRFLGQVHKGVEIQVVVWLWESQIYRDRETAMEMAMMGIELERPV